MPKGKDVKAKKEKLTLREQKLVSNYVRTGKKRQSGIDAGFSPRSAGAIVSETLRKPKIQKAIQSAAEKLGISPEYVLGNFKQIADFNKQKVFKIKNINGEAFNEEEMIDAGAAIKASELLGKHLNLFIDKSEVDLKVEETLESKSKLELAKQIALMIKNPEILTK